MSQYDQSKQNVNNQYNAGGDIVIDSGGEKRIIRDVRPSHRFIFIGHEWMVEFYLSSWHVIVFTDDQSLNLEHVFTLHIDGQKILSRRTRMFPSEKIEHFFSFEGVDCEFLFRSLMVTYDVRIRVGGKEIANW
ncbi:hypothetical protein H6F67_26255 [Microcoleus sp. FACHB-1515]|uniref:hypothetical protein n=1 Tax=Cyanophyceae TaxID=3028117 RepID=UPI001689EE3A|nr:hypothetical protein [Microcoleus sp. FACHB-1515]MBD2093352.1 hypothetical protein [Microcoleus sp. FACHB-1515]